MSTSLFATPRSPRIRRLLRAVAVAVIALVLADYLAVSTRTADMLTHRFHGFDPQETPATFGLAFQDVRFPARDGVEIAGWYIPRAGSRQAIVLVHGKSVNRVVEFGGQFVRFAAALVQRGFVVLMIDLRGHGQSGGERVSFGVEERRDIMGAVDWLKGQGFRPGSIGVLGVSMGAAAGIGAAADDPDIGALVADCSFARMSVLLRDTWGGATGLPDMYRPSSIAMGRLLGYDFYSNSPVDEIGRIAPRPVLVIHGSDDRLVPLAHARELAAAGPSAELWTVAGAGHGGAYPGNPQIYTERVAAFFAQHLGGQE